MPRFFDRRGDNTHNVSLYRWAEKANLAKLSGVRLAHVLAGDSCYPIGLADFEAFLAFRDHSLENLQFVVWYQDYRKRFFELPLTAQRISPRPGPSRTSNVSVVPSIAPSCPACDDIAPSPLRLDEKYVRSVERMSTIFRPPGLSPLPRLSIAPPKDPIPPSSPISPFNPPHTPTTPTSATPFVTSFDRRSSDTRYGSAVDLMHTHGFAYADAHEQRAPGADAQPFRDECMCVLATFLAPSARKELLLDACVRDTAMKQLVWTTHPDVFLPIYESVYDLLESVSLRRFLVHSSSNINRPKQIYWYLVGLTNATIGFAIALSLIMSVPAPPNYTRVYRVFSIPFVSLGLAQVYSAWRGFCSRLLSRDSVQLRVWEMDEMDEEALAYWDGVAGGPRPPPHPHSSPSSSASSGSDPSSSEDETGKDTRKRSAVAPFAGHRIAPFLFPRATARTRNGYRRPPVFGPEKVVMDARVLAAHKAVLAETMRFGVFCLLIWSAIVLSVPAWPRT